jgi:hypothetical protein
LDQQADSLVNGSATPVPSGLPDPSLTRLNGSFLALLDIFQEADAAPTSQAAAALNLANQTFDIFRSHWTLIRAKTNSVNEALRKAGQPPLRPSELK